MARYSSLRQRERYDLNDRQVVWLQSHAKLPAFVLVRVSHDHAQWVHGIVLISSLGLHVYLSYSFYIFIVPFLCIKQHAHILQHQAAPSSIMTQPVLHLRLKVHLKLVLDQDTIHSVLPTFFLLNAKPIIYYAMLRFYKASAR